MLLVTFKYIVFALLMIVCAMLLLLVLMQRPKQEGLGAAFGAQMTDQAFGA
ncbi:MAG: preprotein translocase subunit SecG, partial [Akkermansia sp.]|nr:preprotein translocase subunit SecG [Akkermansia sp.]